MAEDKVKRGHVEVGIGDREHLVFARYPVLNPLKDGVRAVLFAIGVVGGGWHLQLGTK